MELPHNQEQQEEKVELPNRCLGNDRFGNRCKTMLPRGKHFCDDCKKNVAKLSGRRSVQPSSGNGGRNGDLLSGIAR